MCNDLTKGISAWTIIKPLFFLCIFLIPSLIDEDIPFFIIFINNKNNFFTF